MNKLYSVHDHWTDISKKNDVDIESIDGVITGIKVNGKDYGGGGESDFSTAKVDVYFTFEGEPIVLDVAQIMFYIGYPEDATNLNGQYFVAMALNNGASETHPILYKGVATAGYDTGYKDGNPYIIGGAPTVTGDIELDFDTSSIIIKGDGSITYPLARD